MKRVMVACALLIGCGDDEAPAIDAGFTGDPQPFDTAPPGDDVWALVDVDATAVAPLDPGPASTARTVRVAVTYDVPDCGDTAIPTVGLSFETPTAIVGMRAWVPEAGCPGTREVTLAVPLLLPSAGSWQVIATGVAEPAVIEVEAGVAGCDTARDPCLSDCDCEGGEVCLAQNTFGGVTTGCARSCVTDRDCGGGTCDGVVNDGLSYACNSAPECGDGDPCPSGWTCEAGACAPDFVLNQGSRGECASDADCDAGLRCVQPADTTAAPRCQAVCLSDGAWCQGAHVCLPQAQDVSGLAGTDSVCGFLGE